MLRMLVIPDFYQSVLLTLISNLQIFLQVLNSKPRNHNMIFLNQMFHNQEKGLGLSKAPMSVFSSAIRVTILLCSQYFIIALVEPSFAD